MRRILPLLLASILSITAFEASAQYYSWGADHASMRWSILKSDSLKVESRKNRVSVIYPDTARQSAQRLLHYVNAVQPSISFGFRKGPMNIPFIIHPENFCSNGLVMWLPKRVEIISSPAINSYSMPWLKQLAAHEYRHAVQYNNINRGFVKAFSFLLGEQSSTIGLLFMPIWGLEGDATLSETQMSTFGRALQPSFTMHYRALGDFINNRRNTDKWFCGSYREYIPDQYLIGYQITAYADTKYDENIWDKVVNYAVRNPYVFATTAVALKKYYKTSVNALVHETFEDLNRYWSSLPKQSDSATRLDVPTSKRKNYTTYAYPMMTSDGKTIVAFKESLDKYNSVIKYDPKTGTERSVCYTGRVSSRPALAGRKIWWTEYRRSNLFAERVNSKFCWVDIDNGHPHTIHRHRNVLYPTPIDSLEMAWTEYYPDGTYAIIRGDIKHKYLTVPVPAGIEIHSLAWDNYTHSLYFIATDDSGMWLGKVGENRTIEHVTEGAYITLSNLRAHNGVLYFGSIASGRDEAHCYVLAEGKEYRISTSEFGSFSPSPMPNGNEILLTVYDKTGYSPARQAILRDSLHEVTPMKTPHNIVNPPRKKWDVINLDNVHFSGSDSLRTIQKSRSRRFSKFTHLLNVHSWAPASYDPFAFTEEGMFNFNLGATVITQSLLSNSMGYATLGWNAHEGTFVKGALYYYGLGLNLGISASYGGRQQMYFAYSYQYNNETQSVDLVFPEAPRLDKYYNVQASVSLPLYFESGYFVRQLFASAVWNYSNGLVAKMKRWQSSGGNLSNISKIGFSEGLHMLQFGLAHSCVTQMAHKDFLPRLGYSLNISYALNPDNRNFSDLVSLYGKCYLPGVAKHHSLSLAALYQTSVGGFHSINTIASLLSFRSSQLVPHGFTTAEIMSNNYVALSASYQLPICYPEGGINSFIYFKRIRLNIGVDYASFDIPAPKLILRPSKSDMHSQVLVGSNRQTIYSYGVDLSFDVNFFRMPDAATTAITLSVYKPSDKGIFISAGLGLPF